MTDLKFLNTAKILTLALQIGWSIWFLAVIINNLSDLYLHQGNYLLIKQTTAIYQFSDLLNLTLFITVIFWQILISGFLIYAMYLVFLNNASSNRYIRIAYAFSLSLWLAFLIADEIFRNYAIAATHLRIFIAQSTSLIILILINPAIRNGNHNKK